MSASQSQMSASLTKDAWRRLRRDWPAMFALAALVSISLLAVFTPLLPLQAPDADDTGLQYAPPTASPLWLDGFSLDETLLASASSEAAKTHEQTSKLRAAYQAASPEKADAAFDALYRNQAEAHDAIQ